MNWCRRAELNRGPTDYEKVGISIFSKEISTFLAFNSPYISTG
jgi:hypothetical protein